MEESYLYPMKFLPLFKNKIWGGNKIKELGFNYDPLPNCGELWALSGVPGNESIIANGFLSENTLSEALEIYMAELVGEKNYRRFGNQFPILIKIIDANDDLSIQVHPDDALAQQRGLENGKTEMWYILQSDKDSRLIDGFSKRVTPEEYQEFLRLGKLEAILHEEKAEPGDVFFIPAGRVHALGKGLLLAEIQQTSDTTYRIYDYNRPDANGKLRELHTAEALAAIDFSELKDGKTHYNYKENSTVAIEENPYFTTNLIALTQPVSKDFAELDSFVVYLCVEGIAAVNAMGHIVPIHEGECVLIPAVADQVELHPQGSAKLLEVYLDPDLYKGELRHSSDLDWMAKYIGDGNPEDYLDDIDEDDVLYDEEEDESERHRD
ncbi:MAG: class I mannose-6-phosphate isomerase [Bacteroidales bacterium]|nr:class I mannose-6-phosphate isomerase [Bacteroidales bacterium]